jgi:hypothetical protein
MTMSRFRFSLLGLAGMVAIVAAACGALVYATSWLAVAIWCGVDLLLMVAALGAIVRSQPQRAWWIGFALFGWLFVVTIDGPFSLWKHQLPLQVLMSTNERRPTHALLQKLARTMPRGTTTATAIDHYGPGGPSLGMEEAASGMDSMSDMAADGGMAGMGVGMTSGQTSWSFINITAVNNDYVSAFDSTGHALLTLLLACLGGFAGSWFQRRNQVQASQCAKPIVGA